MTSALIAIFIWLLIVTVQGLMTGEFIRYLDSDNPEKRREISTGAEQFWNHLHPLRIGYLYILPGTYRNWGMGKDGLRYARLLRIVNAISVVALLVAVGLLAIALI